MATSSAGVYRAIRGNVIHDPRAPGVTRSPMRRQNAWQMASGSSRSAADSQPRVIRLSTLSAANSRLRQWVPLRRRSRLRRMRSAAALIGQPSPAPGILNGLPCYRTAFQAFVLKFVSEPRDGVTRRQSAGMCGRSCCLTLPLPPTSPSASSMPSVAGAAFVAELCHRMRKLLWYLSPSLMAATAVTSEISL